MKKYTVILTQKELDAIWMVVGHIYGESPYRECTSDIYYGIKSSISKHTKRYKDELVHGRLRF